MKFSRRTDWNFELNRITQAQNDLRCRGIPILDLTCSNPTRVDLPDLDPAVWASLNDTRNAGYDPDSRGSMTARRAVAQYYQDQGIVIDPADIVLTASTSEAYSFLFHILLDAGNEICFSRPGYPLFELLAGIHSALWQSYRLNCTGSGWVLDQESLRQQVHDRTQAVVIVNPNNPTGSCLSPSETDAVYDICRRCGAAVICDEVFLDYPLEPLAALVSLAGRADHLTFVLGGLSKALGLPQMKLSWIVVSGPEDQKREALARLEMIADLYLSVNTPVQNALPQWLAQRAKIQERILHRVRLNWNHLGRILEGTDIERLQARAGWSAMLRLPEACDEEDFCLALLKEDHVLAHPGYFFDCEDGPFLVLSLLSPERILQQGVEAIVRRSGQCC